MTTPEALSIASLLLAGLFRLLEGVGSRMTESRELPYLLTADETADLLRMSRKAVYCMHDRGGIPGSIRRGRRLLFVRDDLLRWIREGCTSSPTGKSERG
jgi:excisionase family DNA binding protein